jgi:hypothetical protein
MVNILCTKLINKYLKKKNQVIYRIEYKITTAYYKKKNYIRVFENKVEEQAYSPLSEQKLSDGKLNFYQTSVLRALPTFRAINAGTKRNRPRSSVWERRRGLIFSFVPSTHGGIAGCAYMSGYSRDQSLKRDMGQDKRSQI